jgi:hypothetical protein
MTKTYTVHTSCINVSGGTYKSKSGPMAAGKKAATKLFKKAGKMAKYKKLNKLSFCIRETTSGSEKKMFDYEATRTKLATPLVRVINGVEIVNKYKTTLKEVSHKKASKPCKLPKKSAHVCTKVCRRTCMKKYGGDCSCNS